MRLRRWMKAGVVATLAMTACDGSEAQDSALPIVQDSAGILIKEYEAESSAQAWRLSAEPVLSVGAGDASPELELYQVRDARWLDSSLLIANSGSSEVIVVDPRGTVRARFGSDGEGPGEFRALFQVEVVPPDSILAFDVRLDRFQMFDRDGELVRTFNLEPASDTAISSLPIGLLTERQLIARGLRRSGTGSDASGVVRGTFDVFTYDLTGRSLGRATTVPAWEAFNPPSRPGGVRYLNTPIPFGASTLLGVLPDQVVVGAQGQNEIRLLHRDGRTRLIIRGASVPGTRITESDAATIKREIVQGSPAPMQADLEAVYSEMSLPERRPAIRGLTVGQDGTIWVSGWPADSATAVPFRVFNGEGDLIATAHVPEALRIEEVDDRRVMGVWKDDLGVESVRVYALAKD